MNNEQFQNSYLRLSQTQLNLLETCPPQFQRLYLEHLGTLLSPEQLEKQAWGSQFHRLMQQRELGLPIESLLQEDEQLQHAITALIEATPEIWQSDGETWREAEHCRALSVQGYLITVIYDLLIVNGSKAQIFDWKTYLQPEPKAKLAKNWQTRLYLYVLAETSDYLPEQISMTYWFVKLPHKPQCLTFPYNRHQHQKTRQDLTRLLTQLDNWLDSYFNETMPFTHLPNCQENCPYYQALSAYQKRLEHTAMETQDWLTSIAEIEEVVI